MSTWIEPILAVAVKDWRRFSRQPFLIVISVVMPLVFIFLYAIIVPSSATGPVVVAFEGTGPKAHAFLETLRTIRSQEAAYYEIVTTDSSTARHLFETGQAFGLIVIPADFDERLAAHDAVVELHLNNINSDYSKNLRIRLDYAVRLFSEQITGLVAIIDESPWLTHDPAMRDYISTSLLLFACLYSGMINTGLHIAGEWNDRTIKTLLLALWKGEDEKITKTESGELGSAVSAYIRRIQQNRDIAPSFDTFYEYMLNDYRKELAARDIKVSREDFNIDNFLTTLRQYYKGGRYDFLLNSNENIDLLHKRFIVFEIDSIKDNAELFPVVTIIIMEAFINKLRRLKGVRKMLICEEAWKALSSPSMSEYLKYMYKTVRKYFGEAIVVTQEVDDIISSPIVKEAIITNSDCKILLDQKKYMNKFDGIQSMLGLTDKEKSQILSINLANHPGRKYKEVWIGLNGVQSAVYATEVSAAEYLTYTTEESEKTEVFALAEELGGDLELAIKRLAETKYK